MTHHTPDSHLADNELLQAMIDLSDLGPDRQAHLDGCPHCQGQIKDLTDRYGRLGQMARQMAPQPRKPFRLPADNAPVRRWYFKPALALGALGVLIFAFSLWVPRFTRSPQVPVPTVARNFANDDQLMAEVDALVENALPEEYQQLASLSGDRSLENLDEFMNWMVPAPEETDDLERPATSDQERPQRPLARLDATIYAAEGTMA